MNWVWNIIEVTINLVETGLFVYLINSKFPNKTKSRLPAAIAVIVGTAGLSLIGLIPITWFPDYLFMIIVISAYALITRIGKVWHKLFWVAMGIALIGASVVVSLSLVMLLPGVNIEVVFSEQSSARFQALVLCKLLQGVIFFVLAKKKDSAHLASKSIMALLILVPFTSILTVLLLIEYGNGPTPSFANQLLMVCASMSILFINLAVFILYESLSRQAESNLQMQTKLQQNEMTLRHNEEIAGIYEEMRAWRHDYHNNLQVFHGYLQLGKYDMLDSYLSEVEKSLSNIVMPVNSGNSLIDSLLSSKIVIARKQNNKVNLNILVPPKLDMSDTDLCVLLGNLLDNAIEACERITDPNVKRTINVDIQMIKNHLYISVSNSTNGAVKTSGETFISSKKEKHHGLGMKRIDEITAKYGGYISRKHENYLFETKITIPLDKAA